MDIESGGWRSVTSDATLDVFLTMLRAEIYVKDIFIGGSGEKHDDLEEDPVCQADGAKVLNRRHGHYQHVLDSDSRSAFVSD